MNDISTLKKRKLDDYIDAESLSSNDSTCDQSDMSEEKISTVSEITIITTKNLKKYTRCQYVECDKTASYGKKGTLSKLFCVLHKRVDDVDLVSKKCIAEGCNTQASFGKDVKLPLFCALHRRIGDINVIEKKCIHPNCMKQRRFGKKGSRLRQFCHLHKGVDDIDLSKKMCLFNNCSKSAFYAKNGSLVPMYCSTHKEVDDVDVKSRRCAYNSCTKRPTFGKKNSGFAEFCLTHKGIDDVNVISRTCLYEGCDKHPNFGEKGTSLGLYCLNHKRVNDIDVKTKKCIHLGCTKSASFGAKGSGVKNFCGQHKGLDDINFKYKRCIVPDCTNHVKFGLLFHDKIHCATHKKHNEYMKNKPKCVSITCKNIPCYTDQPNNYPLRCEDHKEEKDVNVIERECSSCHFIYVLRENGLCNDCHEFINNKVHKAKEIEVKKLLEAHQLNYTSWDRIPNDSCFKYRPDFIFDCGNFIIILEVDEGAHRSYSCHCEIVRMINIFQDFGGLPVCFIRYNPDTYTDHLGNIQKFQTGRQTRLINTIKSLMLHPPLQEMLSVVYLFYDKDNGDNIITKLDYENNNTTTSKPLETIEEKEMESIE